MLEQSGTTHMLSLCPRPAAWRKTTVNHGRERQPRNHGGLQSGKTTVNHGGRWPPRNHGGAQSAQTRSIAVDFSGPSVPTTSVLPTRGGERRPPNHGGWRSAKITENHGSRWPPRNHGGAHPRKPRNPRQQLPIKVDFSSPSAATTSARPRTAAPPKRTVVFTMFARAPLAATADHGQFSPSRRRHHKRECATEVGRLAAVQRFPTRALGSRTGAWCRAAPTPRTGCRAHDAHHAAPNPSIPNCVNQV